MERCVGTLFTSIMGGYAFSRIRFPGRDAIFVAYIGSIMIPFTVFVLAQRYFVENAATSGIK